MRIFQPVPDPERPSRYMSVSETPTHTESGEERPLDDWQPRANVTKLFNMGSISLEHEENITEFAESFYVKKDYILNI